MNGDKVISFRMKTFKIIRLIIAKIMLILHPLNKWVKITVTHIHTHTHTHGHIHTQHARTLTHILRLMDGIMSGMETLEIIDEGIIKHSLKNPASKINFRCVSPYVTVGPLFLLFPLFGHHTNFDTCIIAYLYTPTHTLHNAHTHTLQIPNVRVWKSKYEDVKPPEYWEISLQGFKLGKMSENF